jgi:hypothetical protein
MTIYGIVSVTPGGGNPVFHVDTHSVNYHAVYYSVKRTLIFHTELKNGLATEKKSKIYIKLARQTVAGSIDSAKDSSE